jgi:osmotically-inducible protein OsmY
MRDSTGSAREHARSIDAERVIRRITGVKGLTNHIAVEACVVPADLKQKIEETLVRSAQMDAAGIVVEVEGGRVTLSGTVRSYAEQADAERAVSSAPGVTEVNNDPSV